MLTSFSFFSIDLGYIIYIILKQSVIFLEPWIPTGYFSSIEPPVTFTEPVLCLRLPWIQHMVRQVAMHRYHLPKRLWDFDEILASRWSWSWTLISNCFEMLAASRGSWTLITESLLVIIKAPWSLKLKPVFCIQMLATPLLLVKTFRSSFCALLSWVNMQQKEPTHLVTCWTPHWLFRFDPHESGFCILFVYKGPWASCGKFFHLIPHTKSTSSIGLTNGYIWLAIVNSIWELELRCES